MRAVTDLRPEVAIILGSGLGPLADQVDVSGGAALPFATLTGFPVSTAPGHAGRLMLGALEGRRVAVFQGRVHAYEGYNAQEIVMPVRLAHALGAKSLIVTNACGGLDPAWSAGDLMLITDFINFIGASPLAGPNDPALGERFPVMFDPFDAPLQEAARRAARGGDFVLREGVYIGVSGPAYNTRAELHAWRVLGADAVGMSTVLEVMAARHLGQRVLGLSVITDMAVPERFEHTTEQQVIAAAMKAGSRLETLVRAALREL